MQCIVLAGGLGTRMSAFYPGLPKYLIPVAGVPFARYQLGWLAAHGVCDVVLSIGHRGEMIEEVVGDGAGWGVQVSYARDGQTLLGTGGAVRKAVYEGLLRDHFFVMYGDSFLPVDFASIDGSFLASGRPALMAVFHNRQRYDKGNVLYRDGLVEL